MRIAVLSDIHSNVLALERVVSDVALERPDSIVILGDIFGYYPWSSEVFSLVSNLPAIVIKGNHDAYVSDERSSFESLPYWSAIVQNRRRLRTRAPAALQWLQQLPAFHRLSVNGATVDMYHGTPDDPLNGRFYPDNLSHKTWFPHEGQILLLGHTHYPLVVSTDTGGMIGNPGSVGQPRDGDVRASWGLLDTEARTFEIRRTEYDVQRAVRILERMNWAPQSVAALQKTYCGDLQTNFEGSK